MNLSDLTKKRKEHIKSCQDNNDNSHEIIAKLYSDPSHFVYELLQNADDAKATEVVFNLAPNFLEIKHNGTKLFNDKDVESITTIGSSTKDINSIGTFGAGFKSVFAITKTPQIHSGDYHFKITDFILPEEIEPLDDIPKLATITWLPFNHPEVSKEDAYKQISSRLRELESESLLFLRHIREIQWNTESESGHYIADIKKEKASIMTEDSFREYLLFTCDLIIDDAKLNISVAYLLSEGKSQTILPSKNSNLFVFFPTQEKTGLKFLVHAPYKTTPSRESIPFKDDQNILITEKLSNLIAESLQKIREKGMLNVDFLTLLPIDSENKHPIFDASFQKVKLALTNNPLLPTFSSDHIKASNALLARKKELATLLTTHDCTELFHKESWLSTDITYDKTRELRDYLIEVLNIPEITMEKFCNEISEKFIETKSDDWIIQFYTTITKNKSLYRTGTRYQKKGILRERPVIRLEDNNHVCPENESDELHVYLPSKGRSKFKTVKRSIAENEEACEFLTSLGIEKPDNVSEIKEFIIPRYQTDNPDHTDYVNDFNRVFTIWSDSDEYKKREVIDLLKNINFVQCVDQNKSTTLKRANDVYFPTDRLMLWFHHNNDEGIFFLKSTTQLTEKSRKFLENLGVRYDLKVQGSSDVKISQHGYYKRSINGFNPIFQIHGLEAALKNISSENSIFLWSILLNNTNKLKGHLESRTNQSHPYEKENENTSKAMDVINEYPWLFNQSNELIISPIDQISIDNINDDYNKDSDNMDKLVRVLGLKLDEIVAFEDKTGKKVISQEDFVLLQQMKEEQQNVNEDTDDGIWEPESTPEDAQIIIDESPLEELPTEDLENQTTTALTDIDDEDEAGEDTNDEGTTTGPTNPPRTPKAIGDWGEKIAHKYLKDKYPDQEVIWLNLNKNVGKGYDFVIREGEKDFAYFEVKSKTDESPQLFQISGTQWGWAKRLHKKEKGDMYNILLISNAGKEKPSIKEINNPVALWKSGKIYADPVYIQL